MKPILSDAQLQKAGTFIFTHGRLLERQLYAYFFQDGTREACLKALLAYQNPDGGFHYTSPGNGTEPWGGGSSYASMTAAGIWALYCCGLDATDSRIVAGKNWLFAQTDYHNHNPGNIFDPDLF